MASSRWTRLPPDILLTIAKLLNTHIDYLRLRAVCPTWRVSLHLNPTPFHLNVPPLFSYVTGDPILPEGGEYSLTSTTLYRLSPLIHPHTEGWLFRVSEVSPNRANLRSPLVSLPIQFSPVTFPKSLNLLDHRIVGVSKCYELNYVDGEGRGGYLKYMVRKVIVLTNHEIDCGSVVVVLDSYRLMSYWKVGDEAWAPIDTKDYEVNDVVYCQGKCYAVSSKGALYVLDSGFNLELVSLPFLPRSENFLVGFNSELYAVSKIYEEDLDTNVVSLQMSVFKKCENTWSRIRCLENGILISSDTVSVGISSENFSGRANRVYVAHTDNVAHYVREEDQGFNYCVSHLDGGANSAMKLVQDSAFNWPPPGWLMEIAQDN